MAHKSFFLVENALCLYTLTATLKNLIIEYIFASEYDYKIVHAF